MNTKRFFPPSVPFIFFFYFILFGWTPFGQTQEESITTAQEKPLSKPLRSYRLGFVSQSLTGPTNDSFFQGINKNGMGFAGVYEFIITPRFLLGIDLQMRSFSGNQGLTQLGYGLLMKHLLLQEATQSLALRPYLEYGLLLNVSRQKDRPKSGTSHDTKLALGLNWQWAEIPLYTEISYHISRLSYFEQDSINLDYLQWGFGWRGTF